MCGLQYLGRLTGWFNLGTPDIHGHRGHRCNKRDDDDALLLHRQDYRIYYCMTQVSDRLQSQSRIGIRQLTNLYTRPFPEVPDSLMASLAYRATLGPDNVRKI